MFDDLSQALNEIRREIDGIGLAQNSTSRFPGGRFIHRLFQRLVRRHLEPTVMSLKRAESALVDAVERMSKVWDDSYRHEFEMERRSRSGVLDRLAIIDALQLRIELLEEDLARLRTPN